MGESASHCCQQTQPGNAASTPSAKEPARNRTSSKGENRMPLLGDHWVDIVVVLALAFSVWHGWRTGFLVGIFNLLSIPLGLAAAFFFAPSLAKYTNISLTYMYALVFFGVVIGVHLIGHLLRNLLNRVFPFGKGVDKVLGAVVGAVKAWVLLVTFLVVWGNTLSSPTLHTVACTASTAGQLVGSSVSTASTLDTWQTDYNTAVSNSTFAKINSFMIAQHIDVKGCGK
jgi:uncharacterized membrane protein required for colicin V production